MSMKEVKPKYPDVHQSDHKDMIHGVEVADPYRWLEDPHSNETKEFVRLQNKCTAEVFSHIPYVEEVKSRMAELYNYEKYSCPMKYGGKYFFYKNNGLQNQSVLYQQESLDSTPTILIDPNTLSPDGTAALSTASFSHGKSDKLYFGYGISRGGSDWQTLRVLSVHEGGKQLQDVIQWAKFTDISWTHDDKGFFYSRFPAPEELNNSNPDDQDSERGTETSANTDQQIWYHTLGTPQSDDRLIFAYPAQPAYYINGELSDDGKYLLIYLRDGCKNANMVRVAELGDKFDAFLADREVNMLSTEEIISNMDASYDFILNNGTEFYFKTNLSASRERVVKLDITNPSNIVEVIPEPQGSTVLSSVHVADNDKLIVTYLEDVKDVVVVYDLSGTKMYDIALPGVGSVHIWGKRKESEIFFKFVSFLYPGSIYRFDFRRQDIPPTLFRETNVKGFDASQFTTKQVFYNSKDGTRIPMFIVSRKDIVLNGNNPVYLYGYGGFNISLTPSFSTFRLVFVQNFGGILAIANLRGGGEYGEEWHQAGTFGKKQNVFDDFHAAAEYLIKEKYTNPSKLSIHGGSNGGLLVAACCNQRPELYGCGVAAVGVMDMLRFHKFTVGRGWRSDFGDPDVADNFEYIYKYSPLHNVPCKGPFPALLLTTGDHDDRVVPLHSLKLIAEIQRKLAKDPLCGPTLIRIETKAGHGAGKPTHKVIEEYADVYAFVAWALDVKFQSAL